MEQSLINPDSFSHGQVVSKMWLCEELEPLIRPGSSVTILGGWCNVLGFMLMVRRPNYYSKIINIDLDPVAVNSAKIITDAWKYSGKVENILGDANIPHSTDVVINCSVEHMNNTWFSLLPKDTLVCVQSSDVTIAEHPWYVVQPNPNMKTFTSRFPMETILYDDQKRIQYESWGYTRFMRIGRT